MLRMLRKLCNVCYSFQTLCIYHYAIDCHCIHPRSRSFLCCSLLVCLLRPRSWLGMLRSGGLVVTPGAVESKSAVHVEFSEHRVDGCEDGNTAVIGQKGKLAAGRDGCLTQEQYLRSNMSDDFQEIQRHCYGLPRGMSSGGTFLRVRMR